MSRDSVQAFVERVKQDEKLQEEISALPADNREKAVALGIGIAKAAGFDLDEGDVKALMAEYWEDRELSDEELIQVAGGGNVGPNKIGAD